MTWILGSGVLWGYAALISDTRVSWGSHGPTHDVLQKVHEVGPGVIAGFAGSVEVGLASIDDMRAFVAERGEECHFNADLIAQDWPARIRDFLSATPSYVRALGCQIIVAGVDRGGPLPHAKAIKLSAPDFATESCPPFAWLSIGSGSVSETARHFANQKMKEFGEGVGRVDAHARDARGGVAEAVAFHVYDSLRKHSMNSVSDRLAILFAFPDRPELREPYYVFYDDPTIPPPAPQRPPPLIATLEEFRQFAASKGLRAAQATA